MEKHANNNYYLLSQQQTTTQTTKQEQRQQQHHHAIPRIHPAEALSCPYLHCQSSSLHSIVSKRTPSKRERRFTGIIYNKNGTSSLIFEI